MNSLRNICIILAILISSCAEDAPTTNTIAPPPPTVDTLAVRHADSAAIWNVPSGLIRQARTPNWYYQHMFLALHGKLYSFTMIGASIEGNDATDMRVDGPPHTRLWAKWYDARIPAECRYYGRYDSTGIYGHILVRHAMGDTLMPMRWSRR